MSFIMVKNMKESKSAVNCSIYNNNKALKGKSKKNIPIVVPFHNRM